ncbi:MAG: tetratricopeptide repeat protein [Parvularculaceae bacterium]
MFVLMRNRGVRPVHSMTALPFAFLCVAATLSLAACAGREANGRQTAASADERIDHYADRIAAHPRVYATYLGLAQAYLDKARETHDPLWLAKAEAATQTSFDIMPGIEGYKMQARIAAFRHRFDDTLKWATEAAKLLSADVTDGGVTALLVEAHMGLKQFDEARKLLPADGAPPADFHTAAAMGHWFVSQGRRNDAAGAFEAASRLAEAQQANSLAAWGQVMAAGVYLDAGEIDAARPHLQAAAALDPTGRELRIHEAELMVAEGRAPAAIARYEALIAEAPDAELHRRIFILEQARGEDEKARAHYLAAEELLIRILDAGETYSLDELVRLYVDGGMTAEEARERSAGLLKTSG